MAAGSVPADAQAAATCDNHYLMNRSAAIVGGGMSGLSTAYYLAQAGVASTLIEARPRLGGLIQSEHIEGCMIEGGPDGFLSAKPAAMDLITELGMAGNVIGSNDRQCVTYVWKARRRVRCRTACSFN
jgi:protoporphyrinogen/coproporphyrinogen III oxidase